MGQESTSSTVVHPIAGSARAATGHSVGGVAAAFAGAVLLVDAAVETFHGGSPVWWWVAAAAALYLPVAAVRSTRTSVGHQLAFVCLVFLGVLAITTWRPEGLTNGVRMIGQRTNVVLSGGTLCVLIVAGTVFLRATMIPFAARLIALSLVIYGGAGFAIAAWRNVVYPDLFVVDTSRVAAVRWPFGPVISGLVGLTAALLISLAGGLERGHRSWRWQQIVAIGLALVMVASGFTDAAGHLHRTVSFELAAAHGSSSSTRAGSPLEDGPPGGQSVVDALAFVKQVSQAPTASRADFETRAAEIGNDPAALWRFVHDSVRVEIYSGVLRGAKGAFTAGAANAWDQSLLLAAMLRRHGRDVRFARAHLTPPAASAVIARMVANATQSSIADSPITDVPGSLRDRSRGVLSRIQASWRTAHTDVVAALDRAGLAFEQTSAFDAALAADAADHVWVEYRDGDRWIPLDPVAAGRAGESVTTATETWPDVPDAFYHRVTIRVKAEERRGQVMSSKDILTYSATSAALHGASVVLASRVNKTFVGAGWRATPTLFIDDHSYSGLPLTEAGIQSGAMTPNTIVKDASREVSGVGQVAQLFGGGTPAPVPAASELTAVWLDVEFVDPGKHVEVVRRDLLDPIGLTARADGRGGSAALAPIPVIEGVPVPFAAVHACAFTGGRLDEASPLRRLSTKIDAITPPGQTRALPATLGAIAAAAHVLSQRLSTHLVQGNTSPVFYEATPRLAIASLEFAASPDGRSVTPRFELDLRRNTMRAVTSGTDPKEIIQANAARGVLDAVIEATIAGQVASVLDPPPASAISILTLGRTQGLALTAAASASSLRDLPLPEDVRVRMQAAVSNKLAIVTLTQPVMWGQAARVGWWQIDLSSGEVLGLIDNGLHGAQDEPEEGGLILYLPLEGGPVAEEWAAARYGSWLEPLIVGAILAAALTYALSK